MTWARIDTGIYRNRKVLKAGHTAASLYLASIFYCAENLTDGLIPAECLPLLAAETGVTKIEHAATTLVEVGLWSQTDDGYEIHDYTSYQPSAVSVQAGRDANAQRQANWRERAAEKRNAARKPNGSDPDSNGGGALPLSPTHPTDRNAPVTPLSRVSNDVTNSGVTLPPNLTLPTPNEELTASSSSSTSQVCAAAPARATPTHTRSRATTTTTTYQSMIGDETYRKIAADFGLIAANLSPDWLASTLAAAPPGLDRQSLIRGLTTGYHRIEETATALAAAPSEHRIRNWQAYGRDRVLGALKERVCDD